MFYQKLTRFEVDQSIRVEELNRDTFIGLANTESYLILKLTARTKRRLFEHFRRLGQPKKFAPTVFASAIVLSVKASIPSVSDLIIDIEYPGYELLIINLIKKQLPDILVYFSIIGKKSPAHFAAYGAHLNKKTADLTVAAAEILRIIKE